MAPMITLRKFNASDEETICSKMNVSGDAAKTLISEWSTTQYQGRYFEMFAIAEGDTVVGTISLYELTIPTSGFDISSSVSPRA